ncbi:aspartate aminotransferase family protein [Methanosphaera sp. ISO3-F5]|uniref:aspartate aminotransferase family protein n=1 Tax=Methanosphaera sp. ISO3-F5 TaxID=1452353 RepID=UPI002B262776|nr:aspartate aminotransferase family protein [Methanosphaera sp. ISO3-F5]WQH64949.1 aspartate aminotransferase family protein [Methanosphaera sp. ISO3-F5]
MNTDEVKETLDTYVMHTYGRYDLVIDHAHGSIVYDKEGKEYIDCVAGIAVNNIGHTHKKMTENLSKQLDKLIHVSNLYYTEEQATLAKRLVEVSPHDKVFFANSGAGANEGAIKLARKYTGKGEIIATNNSFHGRTLATITATGQPKYQKGFEPLPAGFKHVDYNDIEQMKEAISDDTAAILVEPIQGESGVRVPDEDYLPNLRKLCDENGILLIFDEVQTGYGRTGKMFASELTGTVPDITTCAKAIAGGLPMGAVLANKEIADAFEPGSHATTFGGTALVCCAANTVLDIYEEENLVKKSHDNGLYFMEKLESLKDKHDCIVDVRGHGLMVGVELNYQCGDLVSKAQENGVLINVANGSVIRFVPPLIITRDELDKVVNVIDEILP